MPYSSRRLNPVFKFDCQARCQQTQARAGVFHTPHGIIETPRFMPVGTLANVKTVTPAQLATTGAQMILANTYHLHLQPGEEIIAAAGGLHQFMGWPGPILTDSGGFQVFSLSQMRVISDAGVLFKSPKDGREIFMSPEIAMQIQGQLGADVIMAFDECPPYPATREQVQAATERTIRWLHRCYQAHYDQPQSSPTHPQALFGIIQGGVYLDLRQACAAEMVKLDLPGYAIGGVSVGEPPELIAGVVAATTPFLPENKPRYLMGVGTYREMAQAIAAGIDLFDCVIPTRLARHGCALVQGERWNLKNARFKTDFTPLDETCTCYTCQNFSRAYLSHLIRSQEVLGFTLLAIHNLTELIHFTQRIRTAIVAGTFTTEFAMWLTPQSSA